MFRSVLAVIAVVVLVLVVVVLVLDFVFVVLAVVVLVVGVIVVIAVGVMIVASAAGKVSVGKGVACDFYRMLLMTSGPVSPVISQSLPLQIAVVFLLADFWFFWRPFLVTNWRCFRL